MSLLLTTLLLPIFASAIPLARHGDPLETVTLPTGGHEEGNSFLASGPGGVPLSIGSGIIGVLNSTTFSPHGCLTTEALLTTNTASCGSFIGAPSSHNSSMSRIAFMDIWSAEGNLTTAKSDTSDTFKLNVGLTQKPIFSKLLLPFGDASYWLLGSGDTSSYHLVEENEKGQYVLGGTSDGHLGDELVLAWMVLKRGSMY